MIPFDFAYLRPDTPEQAVEAWQEYQAGGRQPYYYGGGSEIITMSRMAGIQPGAVIDLKGIPDCRRIELTEEHLTLGGAVTLNEIKERNFFPLLSKACARIADHTNQCRITLGGNLCGTIIYRETALPLLLADASVTLWGPGGGRTLLLEQVFHRRMALEPGEFVLQVHIPRAFLQASFLHIKRTAQKKIGYPLITLAALKWEGKLRLAFSGLCPFPFRSREMEERLIDGSLPPAQKLAELPRLLPAPPLDDVTGSGEYRLFVLGNMLEKVLEDWEHGAI